MADDRARLCSTIAVKVFSTFWYRNLKFKFLCILIIIESLVSRQTLKKVWFLVLMQPLFRLCNALVCILMYLYLYK